MRDPYRSYKRGEIYWGHVLGRRVSSGCRDRQAAIAAFRELERRATNPAHDAATKTTVRVACDAFLAEKRVSGRAAATVEIYRQKAGHLLRVFGADSPLSSIDAPAVDRYTAQRLTDGAGRNTVGKELTTLRGVLKLARRRKVYALDPAEVLPIGWASEYVPRKRWLTAGELELLMEELTPHRAAAVAFVVATGARRGEMMRARREDIDLATGTVLLRGTKSKAALRTVPIASIFAPLVAHVVEYWATHRAPIEKLFPDQQNNRRSILAACAELQIAPATWNDFRRTFATRLRAAGVEPSLLKDMMGHTTSRMVEQVYGRLSPADLGALVERAMGTAKTPPDGGREG